MRKRKGNEKQGNKRRKERKLMRIGNGKFPHFSWFGKERQDEGKKEDMKKRKRNGKERYEYKERERERVNCMSNIIL